MTMMKREAREAPGVVSRQLLENKVVWQALISHLSKITVPFAATIARGSSDHAGTYGKYLLEMMLGIPVVAVAPSIASLYNRQLRYDHSLVLALSQSGQSPDLCAALSSAREGGATTVALVNQTTSPLAENADYVMPVWAGEEKSVAATKSFIGMLSALAQFMAMTTEDEKLLNALEELPARLEAACQCDWTAIVPVLGRATGCLVVGRGYAYPVAEEAALKLKETSSFAAEAFSSAEVLHGPFAMVKDGYPVIIFAQNDESFQGNMVLGEKVKFLGGISILVVPEDKAEFVPQGSYNHLLTVPKSLHPVLDPLMMVQAFYLLADRFALSRGYDPDKPDNLSKVTKTR